MSPRKILFVSSGLGTGGAEVFLVDLVSRLIAMGAECFVVSLTGKGTQARRLRNAGCEVIEFASHTPAEQAGLIGKVRRLIRQMQPDIIQGWMYHGNLIASLAAIGTGRIVCWSIHHSLSDPSHETRRLRVFLWALRMTSMMPKMIQYCSSLSAEQHERYGFAPQNRVVIPNGIDCERFSPDPQRRLVARKERLPSMPDNAFVITHIGRHHPMKDHSNFLQAAALLAAKHPEARFVMIGAGVDDSNNALTRQRRELNLTERVFFMGERGDIPDLLQGVDLVSTSSAWGEAFPIILGEAMATGIPCVATNLGDCALLLGDTGLIVPPKNPQALSEAWDRIMSEAPAARAVRQTAARQRVQDLFAIGSVARQFYERYKVLHDPAN